MGELGKDERGGDEVGEVDESFGGRRGLVEVA